MMFMGYSDNHAENVFQMFNPETSRIAQSRNVFWLDRMYHTRQDADLIQQLPIVTVPISIHDASVDAEIQKLKVAMFPLSEERGVESNSSSEKGDEWIVAKTRYGRAVGRKDGSYNPSTGTTIKWNDVVAAEVDDIENPVANYYEVLGIDENEVKVVPFFLVLFGSKFWIPEQKMARKNVSANQNGEGGGKWEWSVTDLVLDSEHKHMKTHSRSNLST